ncbi:Ppx/GppA phosphatase family protein [Rhizobium sp. SL42]|uniref:Ppx/GppA phosphatase family protein n=1 Tax=Rhizobium sp. SL42 TaxID=2806346 RepID=UPI001F275370|nr:Ppx/GppA phosphatase family protein [Rhizobium sp. SL42]UJW75984.1 Ppx/GppA family phosphatase [Rhizobium sp. SL42]
MTDPDRGGKPKSEGASTGKRKGGNSRRRGKGRKTAAAQAGAELSTLAGSAGEQVLVRRSETVVADGPIRKRKRRRRSKAASGAPVTSGASPPSRQALSQDSSSQDPRPQASGQALAKADNAAASAHSVASAGGRDGAPQGGREATRDPRQASGEPRSGRKRRRNRRGTQAIARPGQVRPLAGSQPPASKPAPSGGHPAGARLHPPEIQSPSASQAPRVAQAGHPHDRPHPDRNRAVAAEGSHDDLYAALDLGTNNCRLLIAQPTRPGQFRVVDAFSRIVRLGEGLAATGRLSQDAMDRAVEALRICATKLAGREIRRMRLIATEACRAAENGEEFLARVTVETGLDLEIINRETEARLAVSGCSSLVGREARSVVLFDIGGGSSEIAVIRINETRSSRLANHITHWTSLPVGVVTLSERHGGRDVTPEVFEAMTAEVAGMLSGFDCPPVPLGPSGAPEDFHLIGTSGTVTTLAGVHLDLPRYDRRKVDGVWLSDAEVTAMQAKLLSWDFAGRAANPCIGPDRADLVLAGCAILEAIRRRWPSTRMRVADRGLREGLLTDMMADDGVWRRGRNRRPPHFRER